MYIIAIENNAKLEFVSEINYKRANWQSSSSPKVFQNVNTATTCIKQVKYWCPKGIFKMYKLVEESEV